MKKIIFGLIATVLFSSLAFGQSIVVDNLNPKGKDTGKIIIIDIARKKHSNDPQECGDCKCGWGICRFCFFCERGTSSITHNIKVYEINGMEFIELQLSSPIIPNVNYDFYIDEDIYAEDNKNVHIEKNMHELDETLGKYGGYIIPLKSN